MSLNRLETFPPVTAGTAQTEGDSASHVINGTLPYAADPNAVLVDGERYWYHAYHSNGVTSGFEFCWGIYTASTDTITRNPIRTSETADALVDWPASSTIVIAFAASPEMLSQWCSQFANKDPREVIWAVGIHHSNGDMGVNVCDDQTAFTRPAGVIDWCTDGTAFDRADLDWRTIDPGQQRVSEADANGIQVGTGRMRDVSGAGTDWRYTRGTLTEFAVEAHIITGRTVAMCAIGRGGLIVGENYGLGWEESQTYDNVAKVASEEIALARAAGVADGLLFPTSPDIVLFDVGGGDALNGTSNGEFVNAIYQYIKDTQDPDRWGWADRDYTKYFIQDMSPVIAEAYPTFNGAALLEELAPDYVKLIDMSDLDCWDNLHFTGESAIVGGRRVAHAALTGVGSTKGGKGSIRARRDLIDVAGTTVGAVNGRWKYKGVTDTAPASEEFSQNVAGDKFRWSKTGVTDVGTFDLSSFWPLTTLHPETSFWAVFQDNANVNKSGVFRLSGLPSDEGTYYEWDLLEYYESDPAIDVGGTSKHNVTFTRKMLNSDKMYAVHFTDEQHQSLIGDTLSVSTDAPADWNGLQTAKNYRYLAGRDNGAFLRIPRVYPLVGVSEKTANVTTSDIYNLSLPSNGVYSLELTVVGYCASNSDCIKSTISRIYEVDGSSVVTVLHAPSVANEKTETGLTVLMTDKGVGGLYVQAAQVTITGRAAEVWEFTTTGQLVELV